MHIRISSKKNFECKLTKRVKEEKSGRTMIIFGVE